MVSITTIRLESLELWSPTLFFLGAAMFVVAAALTVVQLVAGVDRLRLLVGEAFIAGGWIAGLLGLLGLYHTLAHRSRWLSRAGAVAAAIGVVAFVVLAVASLFGFAAGYQAGTLSMPVIYVIPGVFVGSLLAFVSFSGAIFRSDDYPRKLGIVLLVPSAIFLTNLFILPAIFGTGPVPPEVGFVVVSGLALTMLTIGYLLGTEPMPAGRAERVPAEA
jgi:hypothetical protein